MADCVSSLGKGALAVVAFCVASTAAQAAVFDAKTFTLDNGMQVVVVPNDRAPVITHMVWYKVGAADEGPGESGLAHFLEHLMFKGTDELGPNEASQIIARNGGRENAFTSWDYTAYYQNVAADRLELVMRLEADRMTNLVLTDEVVRPEREVVLEERRARVDNEPSSQLSEQLNAMLYLNHPYRVPIIGWKHEIEALDTKGALAFYRKWYAPNNAVLVVGGDVTVEKLRPLAEKYYGKIPARPVPERVRPAEPPQIAARRVVLENARVRQPTMRRSYLAPSYNAGATEHAYPLQVLSEVLGGGATSRLYKGLVVEQGVATAAGSWYSPSNLDISGFSIYAAPLPGKSDEADVAALEAAVDAVLTEVLRDGFTAEEVERAKKRMVNSAIYARDSLGAGPRVIGQALTTGSTVADVEAWPDRVDAVTVEQVNAAARAVLNRKHSVTGYLLPEKTS